MKQFYKLIIILIITYTNCAQSSEALSRTIIDSDRLIVNYGNNTAEFYGNVKIVRSDTTIHCDKAIIYTSENKQIEKQDKTQSQNITKIELFENIVIYQSNKIIKGDIGEYNLALSMITLLDNVSVKDGNNYLEGDKLTYNLKTKIAKVIALKKDQDNQTTPTKDRVRILIPDN